MIKESKWSQYGFPRSEADIQGITIHETGNLDMNAQQLHDWLDNECKTSQATHYICDDTQTIQAMPDDWAVYHTGKGKDWGNQHTIAIEIVSSLSDVKYQSAEDRAVELVKSLVEVYSIPKEMIFFHQDFDNRVYCPKTILDNYQTSKRFVYERIEED